MDIGTIMKLASDALMLAIKLAGPFLLVTLVVGLVVSIIQAATQLQEFTLQFIPKIIAVVIVLVVAGPWMINNLVFYTAELFKSIPQIVNGG
jgi:flagellar biosynthetic protein FliQ